MRKILPNWYAPMAVATCKTTIAPSEPFAFINQRKVSIKKIFVFIFLFAFMGLKFAGVSIGQTTTVFSDNFNGRTTVNGGANTYSLVRETGTKINITDTTITVSGTPYGLLDFVSPSSSAGCAYVVSPLSAFTSPFNATLNANPGLVTWSFNMSPHSKGAAGPFVSGTGGSSTNYAIGVILTTTATSNFTGSGTGYAIVNIGGSSGLGYQFVRFTGGIGGTLTTLANLTTSSKTSWVDIKVVYNPAVDSFTYYFNDEVNSTYAPTNDPSTFTYTNSVKFKDNTYTSTAMASCAFGVMLTTSSGNNYVFDNFKCTVLNTCPATITSSPSNPAAVCAGTGTPSFTVAATGTGLTYQWYESTNGGTTYSGTALTNTGVYSGSGTATLVITNPPIGMNGYVYKAVLNGCATSTPATLTVNASAPSIGTPLPASPAAVCSGAGSASFTVNATNAISYQWQESTTGSGGTFNNITNGGIYSGATSATLTLTNPTVSMSGYAYRVVVGGNCSNINSDGTATLSFVTAPAITTSPSNPATVCAGSGSSSFMVVASGGGLTYQWYESTDGGVTFPTLLSNTGVYTGTGTATLVITAPPVTMNNYQYKAVVTNCSGSAPTNGAAKLTVGAAIATISGPTPSSTTINPGGNTNFAISVTGTGLTYHWYYSPDGVTWTSTATPLANFTFTNGTTNTLTVSTTSSVAVGSYYYRCTVSSASCSVNSGNATLQVVYPDPTLTSLSPSSVTEGNGAFTLTVNGTNFKIGAGVSVVYWNGVALTTTYVSSTQLTASVPAANVAVGTGGTTPSITVKVTGAVNPSNALSFTINAAATGCGTLLSSYTIDPTIAISATNFQTFTAAVNMLNTSCTGTRSHPITFYVKAGQTFTENVPALKVVPATLAANYIVFKTDGSSPTHPLIQSGTGTAAADAIVTIQGTNYIVFDGIDLMDNAANTTAAARAEYGYFLITNLNTGGSTIGAQYDTIRNCIVTLNKANTNRTYGVLQSGNGGVANSGNMYDRLTVYNAIDGIVLSGNASINDIGNTVQNCIVGPAISGTNNLGGGAAFPAYGIAVGSQSGVSVHDNIVRNITLTSSNTTIGLSIGGAGTGTLNVYNNIVYNITNTNTGSSSIVYGINIVTTATTNVYLNKIYNISNSGTSSNCVTYGMFVTPAAATTTNIFSNCISEITGSYSGSNRNIAGINFNAPTSGTNATGNIYFNSIWFADSYACTVADFYTIGSNATLNIKENIFKYNGIQTNSSNKAYCVYFNSGVGVLNIEDYNIYDMIKLASPYETGYDGSNAQGSLVAWKNATGKDINSQQFFTQFVSVTDLHLSDYPSSSYTGSLADVSSISPSTDIDGQARTTPTIGADEISITTSPVVVISAPNQPDAANIARGISGLIIGQYNLASYSATAGSNADPVLNSVTLTVKTLGPTSATSTDFTNFKISLFDASSLTDYGVQASYPGTVTYNAGGTFTMNFTLASPIDLTGGDTYYLYLTTDVNTSVASGSNIHVDTTTAASFSFSASDGSGTPVTKIASSIIDSAGKQTVCTFYYNTAMLDPGTLYPKTTNIDDLNGWRALKTGSVANMGGVPPNFTNDYQVFNIIRNGATFSSTIATWNLSGAFSKAIVGDGSTTPVRFIVPNGNVISDTVDVMINGTLQLFTTPVINSLTLGTLSDHSTVEFSSSSSQTIPVANYGNIILDSAGDKIFPAGTIGIKDSLKMQSTGALTAATGNTINFNGITPQIIPGYNHNNFVYYNLNVNNTGTTATQIGELLGTAESVYVSDSLTLNSNLLNKTLIVPAKDSIILTSAAQGVLVSAGSLQVNGAIVSNAVGAIFNTSSASCQFNIGSIFRLATADVSTANAVTAQIPIATWSKPSTCLITGIIGVAGSDYQGLGGNYQAFSNFVINCPNLVGKLLLTNAANSGFSADTLRVTNTGSNPAGHTGFVQIPRQGTQETVNVKYYFQESGYVTIAQNISSAGSRIFNVANDFTVYDNLPSIYPSKFEIMNTSSTNSPAWYGKLTVGGNFYMAPTATLSQGKASSTQQATADLSFNGSNGNQNATFGIIFGNINFEVNKTQVSGAKDTVKLLTNAIADSFYLTKGVFAIGSNTLTVNGPSNTVYAPGTGTYGGSKTSNLSIGSSAFGASTTGGTLKFATNTLGAPYNNYLKNLTLYGNNTFSSTATLGNALNITGGTTTAPGVVSVGGNGLLSTGGFLTLKSDTLGTARVDSNTIATSGYITGNTTIERYYPSHRSWRLVSVPISATGAPTIKASWQEGASNTSRLSPIDPNPGYGTIITKTTSSVNGYDAGSTSNPSIYYFTGSAWVAPSGTSGTTPGANAGVITDQPGYMLFVRGSRNYIVATQFQPSATTTLRVTGGLKQGSQTFGGTGMTVIGNPYASTIYYDAVIGRAGSKLPNYYYVWDPLMTGTNGVGSFITLQKIGAHQYTPSPDPSATADTNQVSHTIDLDGRIESGQAVLAYFTNGSGSVAGTSSIQETDKTIQNDNYAFRPAAPLEDVSELFRTNLFAQNSDGTTSLEDGVLDVYNNQYSDTVNFLEDAPKLGNISETIGLFRNGYNLAIESRKIIGVTDNVYYSLFGMQQKSYIIQFQATNLDHPGLGGFLIDSFTHTRTPLSLVATTNYKFSVTSNTASSALHRFTVIFIPAEGGPLPVTFTNIKAAQQTDKNIAVQWNVENQLNIKSYEVQKSTNGSHYTTVNTTTAVGGNVAAMTYNWVDSNTVTGDNYYRIMSIGTDGTKAYSHVADVKVATATFTSSIRIYPNPISGKTIGVQFTNLPEGNYGLKITNAIGQTLFSTTVYHPGGNATKTIEINNALAKGVYNLDITYPDNLTRQSIQLIAQ